MSTILLKKEGQQTIPMISYIENAKHKDICTYLYIIYKRIIPF